MPWEWKYQLVISQQSFGAEGRWFDSTSSSHVKTLGKSFTRNCLYDVLWRPVAALRLKFDSCNSLLSSVHTSLVNILRCVRLYIKNETIIINITLFIMHNGFIIWSFESNLSKMSVIP